MNRLWITWDDHRRSRELADAFQCDYIVISSSGSLGISHLMKAIKTTFFLIKYRKSLIFVQNPSRILAALAAFAKIFFGFKLVVDRHTNFRIGKRVGYDPREWFALLCSEFSLRFSDLTIVTNAFLKDIVASKGGRALVLPDRIPAINKNFDFVKDVSGTIKGNGKIVVFICTFADDEPYQNVIQSARFLHSDVIIYITGRYNKQIFSGMERLPPNVILTGYIPDNEYEGLLHSANAILDFTTLDWCLVCGGYEAMSVGKPFVTSDTVALKEFYQNGALYSDHSPEDIANNIKLALDNEGGLALKLKERSKEISSDWKRKLADVEAFISNL